MRRNALTEEIMSLSADLAVAKSFFARAESIGEEGFTLAERLLANPESASVAQVLAQLAGLNLPPGYITGLFATAEKMLAVFTAPQPAAAQ
jgi:hypothetical protein